MLCPIKNDGSGKWPRQNLTKSASAVAYSLKSLIDPVRPAGAVVDTTGAGDCFYAGLIAGLLNEMDVADAGRLGAACGAACVTGKGAATAAPSYPQAAKLAGLID